jgi:hypothetical protein
MVIPPIISPARWIILPLLKKLIMKEDLWRLI